eukprot:scaffold76568_cov69-Phaeocystis_antarctica.AAC.1
MWTRTHVSFAQEHARGEPHVAPQRALGAANRRARLSEGDETQKYGVECVERRSTVSLMRNTLPHSTPFRRPSTLYPLYTVEGGDFTPHAQACNTSFGHLPYE